jgi:hypothetical protein
MMLGPQEEILLPALSKQYIFTDITTDVSGDPSGTAPLWAFLTDLADTPDGTATWYTGSWVSGGGPTVWKARVLVGPSGGVVTFTVGVKYAAFVKLSASPEAPIIRVGIISVI